MTVLGRIPAPASSPELLMQQAIELLVDVYAILGDAFGPELDGSQRGELASSHYLARIRDRLRGYEPPRPAHICAECIDLRQRLINVYHLTLTGHDAAATVQAIREASGPGAPAPGYTALPEEWVCIPCSERNVIQCDEDRCCLQCGMDLNRRAELLRFLAPPAPPRQGANG